MKCAYDKCGKELPEGHKRIYCDDNCMRAVGAAKQKQRVAAKMKEGQCINCGNTVYKRGRFMPRFCSNPECAKIFAELQREEGNRRVCNKDRLDRIAERLWLKNREGCILKDDGSVPMYYLTRGDPFAHGIVSI